MFQIFSFELFHRTQGQTFNEAALKKGEEDDDREHTDDHAGGQGAPGSALESQKGIHGRLPGAHAGCGGKCGRKDEIIPTKTKGKDTGHSETGPGER